MSNLKLTETEVDFLFDMLIRCTKAAQESAMMIIQSVPTNVPLRKQQEEDILHYHQIAEMSISVLEKLSDAFEAAEMQGDRVLR